MHVKFNVPTNDISSNIAPLLANDIFVHYFAESELEISKTTKELDDRTSFDSISQETLAPFDGISCKAFKVEKLMMGQQSQRMAAFEEGRSKST